MIVIGILLILVVAAVVAGFAVGGGDLTAIHLGNVDIESTTSTFFFGGVATALAAVAGAGCLVLGVKRWRVRRRELIHLRQQTADTATLPAGSEHRDAAPAGKAESPALEAGRSGSPASADEETDAAVDRGAAPSGDATEPGGRRARPPEPSDNPPDDGDTRPRSQGSERSAEDAEQPGIDPATGSHRRAGSHTDREQTA